MRFVLDRTQHGEMSFEHRQLRHLAAIRDDIQITQATSEQSLQDELLHGAIPVGSVQFIYKAIGLACLTEPQWNPYPSALFPLMGRSVAQCQIKDLPAPGLDADPYFIRPAEKIKIFDGFVRNEHFVQTHCEQSDWITPLIEHANAQEKTILSLPPSTKIYVSNCIRFIAEYRFYVTHATAVMAARYDDLDNPQTPYGAWASDLMVQWSKKQGISNTDLSITQALMPWVNYALAQWLDHEHIPAGFSLDVGLAEITREHTHPFLEKSGLVLPISQNTVLAPVLIEVNDGWALGLYAGSHPLNPLLKDSPALMYAKLLAARWNEMLSLAPTQKRR